MSEQAETAVCRCGHAKSTHEFEDEGAVSCCMARVWVSSVGAGEPRHCMCPGYEPSLTPYGHCSGCTDPDPFGGTHCEGTIEHPLAVPAPVPRATQRVPSRECMLLAHAGCKGCGCSCHDVGGEPLPAPQSEREWLVVDSMPEAMKILSDKLKQAESALTTMREERDIRHTAIQQPFMDKIQEMSKELAGLREERDRAQAALGAIESLCSDEITARFGGHPHKSEDELGRNSRVYALLVVPRNIARAALKPVSDRQPEGER